MKKSCVLTLIIALTLVLTLAVTGCAFKQKKTDQNGPVIDPKPSQEKVTFTLYFADQEAMYLKGEERIVPKGGSIAELMVNELIKGPELPGLVATIPKETKLLSLEIKNGVAYVNFSKEIKTNHWGGSAGETMTVFSVVNTLGQLPEIKKVQFLIEGEKQEAIWGHYYTLEPFEPDPKLISPTDREPGQNGVSEELIKPGDFFPLTQGSTWQYLGEGMEYASFTREVLYAEGNKAQTSENNGGTVSTSVYRITPDAVTVVYFQGEDYEPKNMLNAHENINLVLLKAPLQPGNKWTDDRFTREIVEVKVSVNTPAGKFDNCIKVKISNDYSTLYEYYKQGVGLVKREFQSENDKITSILANYSIK